MSYSGATQASQAKQKLSEALAALQQDTNIPPDVMTVTEHIAQAVGALFEAEKAGSEIDGKHCVQRAMSFVSQTLALLQDVRADHQGIQTATQTLANAMSTLFPLTSQPSRRPPGAVTGEHQSPSSTASGTTPASTPASAAPYNGTRAEVEANIGANTETNFFVGFSGEISEGGVFVATYNTHPVQTRVTVLVTLPGGFEVKIPGTIRFVRDPMDMDTEAEPGMGIAFDNLSAEHRELVLRFIKKRAPMFYDE